MRKLLLLSIFIWISSALFSQSQHPKFKECLKKAPDKITTFCVKDDVGMSDFLMKEHINVKYRTEKWLFISATPAWMDENQRNGNIKQFYYETAPAVALTDTSRATLQVNQVQAGSGGLTQSYKGDNVIIGIIDEGIDFSHPDFKDANGKTRIMRIWDQKAVGGANSFQPYGYGLWWDSTSINNGTCTHTTVNGHGTAVASIAVGNGLSDGTNRGMAPNSKIVMVGTDLNANNWSLTVADACDFIFKYADSLGLPAVVNISAGSYFGSHDGNDPASVFMEQLLDAKGGRLIVAAAGNSGSQGKYHLGGNVTTDTTFVWFKNNASHITYFDLWADTSVSHFDYGFEMTKPSNFSDRGQTIFRNTHSTLGTVVYDTIWNGPNRIATMQIWTELIDSAYHLEFFMDHVDSTSYYCKFKTSGTGRYDLWSGAFQGANDMLQVLPSSVLVPEIIYYQMPDSLQTIVSSFNCSEKVLSVGNYRNRYSYTDKNGLVQTPTPTYLVGTLSVNSSKGPSRINHLKPQITAPGDFTFAAFPMWYLANTGNNTNIDQGGWHARAGGTSSAAPVMAGIGGLYFEKCPNATYRDFMHDLIATAKTDQYTGASLPNFAWGYGKPNALNLMLGPNNVQLVGGPTICSTPVDLTTNDYAVVDSIIWSTGLNATTLTTSTPNMYSATIYYGGGCSSHSDTVTLVQGQILPNPVITSNATTLSSNSQSNYQWTLNGVNISGATNQTLNATPPYGTYAVTTTSPDGCISTSNTIDLGAGILELEIAKEAISPNPTTGDFSIKLSNPLLSVKAYDINGKEVNLQDKGNNSFSVSHLKTGTYYLNILTEKGLFHSKIVKM